jgi:hypothetical protein
MRICFCFFVQNSVIFSVTHFFIVQLSERLSEMGFVIGTDKNVEQMNLVTMEDDGFELVLQLSFERLTASDSTKNTIHRCQ